MLTTGLNSRFCSLVQAAANASVEHDPCDLVTQLLLHLTPNHLS